MIVALLQSPAWYRIYANCNKAFIMESQNIENWQNTKERLKEKYPHLTEDDLIYEIGKEEELLQRLQTKLNTNRQEIRKWLSLMG